MDLPALQLRHHQRWLIGGGVVIVALVVAASTWWVTRDTSYTQQDITDARAKTTAIGTQFTIIDDLQPAQTAQDNLTNNAVTSKAYDAINQQVRQLSKSPTQHNQKVHSTFKTFNSVWSQKYTYAHDDLAYLYIVDTYDGTPALNNPTDAASDAAALKVYTARETATVKAQQALDNYLTTESSLNDAKADFATYLSDSSNIFRTIIASLQEHKDLIGGTPVTAQTNLSATLTQESQSSLTSVVNTYLSAANTDYARINNDLSKLNVQQSLTSLNAALANAKPVK